MRGVIIVGSSRSNGNTMKKVRQLNEFFDFDVIDLNLYQFSYYDYEHQNREDDFLPLMQKIIENNQMLIFATPVYWYSMSGLMKVFFDRLTDLLTIEKDLGRQLRGKKMAVINCSNGGNLGNDFWHPFVASAEYLGMDYLGNLHTFGEQDNSKEIEQFALQIKEKNSLL